MTKGILTSSFRPKHLEPSAKHAKTDKTGRSLEDSHMVGTQRPSHPGMPKTQPGATNPSLPLGSRSTRMSFAEKGRRTAEEVSFPWEKKPEEMFLLGDPV